MGMFDSFYIHFKNTNKEIQTKCFESAMNAFKLGNSLGETDTKKIAEYKEYYKKNDAGNKIEDTHAPKTIIDKGKFQFYLDCFAETDDYYGSNNNFFFVALICEGIWLDYSICEKAKLQDAINSLFKIWDDERYYSKGTLRLLKNSEIQQEFDNYFFKNVFELGWKTDPQLKRVFRPQKVLKVPFYEEIKRICNNLMDKKRQYTLEGIIQECIKKKIIIGHLPIEILKYSYLFSDQSILLLQGQPQEEAFVYLISELGLSEKLLLNLKVLENSSAKVSYNLKNHYKKLNKNVKDIINPFKLFDYSLSLYNQNYCINLLAKYPKIYDNMYRFFPNSYHDYFEEILKKCMKRVTDLSIINLQALLKHVDGYTISDNKTKANLERIAMAKQHHNQIKIILEKKLLTQSLIATKSNKKKPIL